jgi:hypothetical protein
MAGQAARAYRAGHLAGIDGILTAHGYAGRAWPGGGTEGRRPWVRRGPERRTATTCRPGSPGTAGRDRTRRETQRAGAAQFRRLVVFVSVGTTLRHEEMWSLTVSYRCELIDTSRQEL